MSNDYLLRYKDGEGKYRYVEETDVGDWDHRNLYEKIKKPTNFLTHLLRKWGRERIIYDPVTHEPYMYRYYLLFNNHSSSLDSPFNLMINNIVLGDPTDLHDHPWDYITFLTFNGYYEVTPKGKFWRGFAHIRYSKAEDLHKIELKNGKPAWSLFFHFRKRRNWGFVKGKRWIDHGKYLSKYWK